MRPDGIRVKDLPPLVAAIPYIMPKRYDAWNSITENIDEEAVKAYIRHWRREGVRLNHMSVIIAAYYRAVLDNPKLNYFVMNGKFIGATTSASPSSFSRSDPTGWSTRQR